MKQARNLESAYHFLVFYLGSSNFIVIYKFYLNCKQFTTIRKLNVTDDQV
jgi:hypothetical protein